MMSASWRRPEPTSNKPWLVKTDYAKILFRSPRRARPTPLRQRAGEIAQLLAHFIKQLATRYNLPMRSFSRPPGGRLPGLSLARNFASWKGFFNVT